MPSAVLSGRGALRAPAGRVAYVNGRYLPHGDASVHIEDRGLQFADSVYEVCTVTGGRFLDQEDHLARLERSLSELGMAMPMAPSALSCVMRELVRRNRVQDGLLYLQVTRGAHKRDHPIPEGAKSFLIMTVRPTNVAALRKRRAEGVAVVTRPDIRWGRCDIKSTALLANILVKTEARKAGAYEAWLVDRDGFITEGASSNAWIVTPDNVLLTRNLSNSILAGVTRKGVLSALTETNLSVEERPFTVNEAYGASEAFITSASGGVMPVVRIDDRPIGGGAPGPAAQRIHRLYREFLERPADG